MRLPQLVGLMLLVFLIGEISPARTQTAGRDLPKLRAPNDPVPLLKPMALKDKETGVLFYFETDGQHVSAIDADGKILWHKNPIVQAKLIGQPGLLHGPKPLICTASLEIPASMLKRMQDKGIKGKFLLIGVSTKHFGLLDQKNGSFYLLGRD